MVNKPKIKENKRPKNILFTKTKSGIFKIKFPNKIMGRLIMKLSLNAVVSSKFLNKKLEIVNPLLERPGKTEICLTMLDKLDRLVSPEMWI